LFEVSQIIPFEKIALEATGDLNGRGIWIFQPTRDGCEVSFDWNVRFDKPFLSEFSYFLRPVFELNHRWAMNKGLESLKLKLLRRKGIPGIPPPPLATFPHRQIQNVRFE